MKLSVCIICKNEEKTIENVLKCAEKFADEIIVCDTGSTDNTKNLAKKYTQNIYDFEWVNDFSKARNYSFSLAKGEYIMWLDADDNISKTNIEKLCELKNNLNGQTNIFMLPYILSFDENGKPLFSFYRERIIKNSSNNYWQGFIHEAIVLSGKIEYLDIEIEHRKKQNNHSKRNLNIYNFHKNKGVEFSARNQYYYAKELFYNNYLKKCIVEMKKYLKMSNKYLPNHIDALITLSRCYDFSNDKKSAIKVLTNNLYDIIPTSEYFCQLGYFCHLDNKIDMAICFYYSALMTKPQYQNGFFVEGQYYYYIPLINLCILLYDRDYQSSKIFFEKLKRDYPNDKYVIFNEKFFLK